MIYLIFILDHFIFDKIVRFQCEVTKKKEFWHCLVYTIGFIPIFLIFKVNFGWLLLIFLSHFLIDKKFVPEKILRDFEEFLIRKFKITINKMRMNKPSFLHEFLYYILVVIEQLLHIAILVIIIKLK